MNANFQQMAAALTDPRNVAALSAIASIASPQSAAAVMLLQEALAVVTTVTPLLQDAFRRGEAVDMDMVRKALATNQNAMDRLDQLLPPK